MKIKIKDPVTEQFIWVPIQAKDIALLDLEDKLDSMEFKFRNNHFDRLSNNACGSAIAASVYADILGNLERMGDHCRNIGRSTVSDMPLGNHVDF